MKYLKVFIPTAVLLLAPWGHKLIYSNIMLAWPQCNSTGAHYMGICGALFAAVATSFIMADLK